jgi:hypothetical protein
MRPYLLTFKDTGGELQVQAERSDGHWGRGPIDRARWGGGATSASRTPHSPPVSLRVETQKYTNQLLSARFIEVP